MTAFDQAWDMLKMARHIINDDVEFWDRIEAFKNSFGVERYKDRQGIEQTPFPEGYENLPKFLEREQPMPEDFGWSSTGEWGEDGWKENPKEKWRSYRAGNIDSTLQGLRGDGYVYGRGWFPEPELPEGRDKPLTFEEIQDIHRQYYDDDMNFTISYPWSGGIGRFDHAKIMLTPNEYLKLAYEGHYEPRALEFVEQWKKNEGRTPVAIPYLSAELYDEKDRIYPNEREGIKPLSGQQDFKIVGHEGRHRMAALRAMGMGDVPVPVQFELGGDSKHAFGKDPEQGRHKALERALSEGVSFLYSQDGKKVVPYFRTPNKTWGVGEVDSV